VTIYVENSIHPDVRKYIFSISVNFLIFHSIKKLTFGYSLYINYNSILNQRVYLFRIKFFFKLFLYNLVLYYIHTFIAVMKI